jgi:hypothetical protein
MTMRSLLTATTLLLLSLYTSPAAEPEKPVKVTTLKETNALSDDTKFVEVIYFHGLQKDGQFVAIMKSLASNPNISHLRLHLPNSSHIKNEHLEVLREFKHLESFDLEDDRDFGGDDILEQTMAMPKLKQVKLEFG